MSGLAGHSLPWRRDALIVAAFVLLVRLPFLAHPVQGDDLYYLAGAQHAQIDPLHPTHTRYVFLGDWVDMRGHPHPPLNSWLLAALLAWRGDVEEVPFHAAYLVLSLMAALAMYALARRFAPHPLWATLLFCSVIPFVVNGASLESDLPLVAFWTAGVALYVWEAHWALTALALALAALTAFQAVLLTPILAVYAWLFRRRSAAAWLLALTPPAALAGWQLFELLTSGTLPLAVLQGHFQKYGFQGLTNKMRNAAALAVHACWIVPPFLPLAAAWNWRGRDREALLLGAWAVLFFSGALVMFFSGAARYLWPMAAPVCLLVARLPIPWLAAGVAMQLTLSLGLAWVNLEHWSAYRAFAESLREHAETRRVWINGEWGLRFYLEALGGLPLVHGQAVRPGEIVVTSELGYPASFTTGGGALTPLARMEIRPALPLRLIGLESRSAYSTYRNGYWPFDVSRGVIDRVRAELVVEREPAREWLPMNAPDAAEHLVSGIDRLEENRYRWMMRRGVLLLRNPPVPKPVRVQLYLPEGAAARELTIEVDGRVIERRALSGPGAHTVETAPVRGGGPTVTLALEVDRTFSSPGDRRELGIVLAEAGFR